MASIQYGVHGQRLPAITIDLTVGRMGSVFLSFFLDFRGLREMRKGILHSKFVIWLLPLSKHCKFCNDEKRIYREEGKLGRASKVAITSKGCP